MGVGPGTGLPLRVSLGRTTTAADIERFLGALGEIFPK
jgi:selenocysteine lyase/cysteine desulfurase